MFNYEERLFADGCEIDERATQEYLDGLCQEFAHSPEGTALTESGRCVQYTTVFLDYYLGYIGRHPARMTLSDFNEVVFSIFPRKLSTEPDSAPIIIVELRAFLAFLERQHAHPQAGKIGSAIADDSAIERLRRELSDESNFGIAKSFVMMGRRLGYDMTTREGMDAFREHYNSEIIPKLAARTAASPPKPSLLPLPLAFARPNLWDIGGPTGDKQLRKAKKAHVRQRNEIAAEASGAGAQSGGDDGAAGLLPQVAVDAS